MSVENLPEGHPAREAAQTTPPVTPAVTPAPTVQPEPQVVYQNIPTYDTDSITDTAVSVFATSAGIEASRFDAALVNALNYGDEKLIDYTALTQGLKPDQAAQAKALAASVFKDRVAREQAHIQASAQKVYAVAGSAEAWKEASDAFNVSAPDHLKAIVRQMLDNGDVENAAKFVIETARGTGMVNNGTPPIQGGTGAVQQGLTQEQYYAELAKLERSAGNRSFESGQVGAEFQRLRNARILGRKQGL